MQYLERNVSIVNAAAWYVVWLGGEGRGMGEWAGEDQ